MPNKWLKGASKKIKIAIVDSEGDPVDPETLSNVKVWIYNEHTFEIIQKYSKNIISGFKTASVDDDDNLVVILDSEETTGEKIGKLGIQVNLYVADGEYEDSTRVVVQKGIIGDLLKAI